MSPAVKAGSARILIWVTPELLRRSILSAISWPGA